jgi:DNA-directed RNA polymerase specialized sigma24 family protein
LLLAADGLSYQEAAQALGIPAGTLSSRLARARRQIRVALGGVNPAGES